MAAGRIVGAAVDDVALVAGEEVEVDVAEWAVGAPVRLLDVVPAESSTVTFRISICVLAFYLW